MVTQPVYCGIIDTSKTSYAMEITPLGMLKNVQIQEHLLPLLAKQLP